MKKFGKKWGNLSSEKVRKFFENIRKFQKKYVKFEFLSQKTLFLGQKVRKKFGKSSVKLGNFGNWVFRMFGNFENFVNCYFPNFPK